MTWERFQKEYHYNSKLDFAIDTSRMDYPDGFFQQIEPLWKKAIADMSALEKGAIANPDEGRQVGHYWLRDAALAPDNETANDITSTLERIKDLAARVHSGDLSGSAGPFAQILVIGIGGSALGPQFVEQALGHPATDKLGVYFFDNTDPDGIDLTLSRLQGKLGNTLSLVISKSGGTPETRNGMLEAQAAYTAAGLDFSKHAIAITGTGSKLDNVAESEGWIERFPMWDWVGGRTSELGPVGLIPAALQGVDIDGLLDGAQAMDTVTRTPELTDNPAGLMAAMWYHATDGKGAKDMVILPYKDRLMLFSKYLQQLVMESLGKEKDLDGNVVNQGIAVYGNKGSTDQHAYVQQLREGVANFYAVFIEVLKDRAGESIEVDPGIRSGDYLHGFLLGTRDALYETGRQSITLTITEVNAFTVGMLIALFERAVGYYASFVNINAYHQPGVEAGKKAAASVLDIQQNVMKHLPISKDEAIPAEEIAKSADLTDNCEIIFKILNRLAQNPYSGVTDAKNKSPQDTKFYRKR
ncbi:MAG: glucose-6-phosphate isomerase [Opitutales bacterium]|nr:glucose-6-phosphate isomerase [Opitutales bacterium]